MSFALFKSQGTVWLYVMSTEMRKSHSHTNIEIQILVMQLLTNKLHQEVSSFLFSNLNVVLMICNCTQVVHV